MIRVGIFGESTMIQAGLRAVVNKDPGLELVEAAEECDVLLLSGSPGLGSSLFLELLLPEPVPPLLVITDDVKP
jgi:hypothetical protein